MAGYCVCFLFALFVLSVTCQEYNENESIDVSRIKREGVPENRDLTVLLVNDQKRNDYNTKIGRYHSVKPLIGLLTSTARTFIQDGVTTEYATQILGTTLDNGRIYAQLLTKSSLVLYNKPSDVDDAVFVQPTRVHSAFDGQWNVKQDLGIIDPDKFVLKNTDYLAPSSKMEIVYASRPAQDTFKFWNPQISSDNHVENQIFDEPSARKAQPLSGEPKFEVYNYLDGPAIESEKNLEYIQPNVLNNVNTLYRQSKAYEPVTEPFLEDVKKQEDRISESNIVKVKPSYDLPTFTIKNEFSPIFYYIDNVESRRPPQDTLSQTKLPKRLFGQKSEPRPKKTFTYAGFADFTTVVGDTVIIFTPNTEIIQPPNPDQVNVFPSAKPVDKLATKITFLSADIPLATSTFKPHEVDSITKVPQFSIEENISEKSLFNDEESLKKVMYVVDDKVPDTVSVQYNNNFELNVDVIQPSEPGYVTTESTRVTEDLEVVPIKDLNFKATDPLRLLEPTTTILDAPKESAVTEGKISEQFANSEEEIENTAAEVTEKMEEDEDDEEEEDTQEVEPEILTTTESGHSDESYEIESTTENKYNKHEKVFCSDGLETESTMTTAYKTLTYLTTYFIPLESMDTTTSIKSDVVVESDVGYITNYICKTNLNIAPTSVFSAEMDHTPINTIESPELLSENDTNMPVNEVTEAQTERPSETTPMEKEVITTVSKDDEITSLEDVEHLTSDDNQKQEVSSLTTTTERVSTSQSHIEVSVSTEHTPTESLNNVEDDIRDSVNEIDLIYKTLYTTYTYFTTFFGEQTSSVASHKSVVTNIITSTIDLSKLDPSLLVAFDEGEIAPTDSDRFRINSMIDLVKNKDVIESVEVDKLYSSQTPTPNLSDDFIYSINPESVQTYYTTYTFFTTIYVGSDANICSRNEVHTNFVGPDELLPTKVNSLLPESTRAQFDFRNCKLVKGMPPPVDDHFSVEKIISSEPDQQDENKDKENIPQPSPIEVDMLFSVESNPLVSDNDYVTDIKSSSSKGETKYLENNNVLDDQISSESNIDEILPSPTLLLQTSYTTFTYFTTMYIGQDSSKVKSRLETITNVVTETITPKTEPEEENNLPITYYTTFTYWTTLYKDKSTTITSREDIVSNVVTPLVQSIPTVSPIDTTPIDVVSVLTPNEFEIDAKPSFKEDALGQDDGKTTVFTTYTYFTTFYAGNTSQIRSSLETVTNIVDNTQLVDDNQLGRKVPSGSVDKNLIKDIGEKPHVVPTKVKEEILATKVPDISLVSSTILQGTYIDNLFAEVKPDENNTSITEKKILFSQVAVISGDSTIVTNDNKTLEEETTTTTSTTSTTTTEGSTTSPTPEIVENPVIEHDLTTELTIENEEKEENSNAKKKGRLTFTTKKPSFTPVIIPFASRNRPTFSPKRLPIQNSATTITRADFTPTITATPTLKSVRPSGGFSGSRKQAALPGSSSSGRRFVGRSSAPINLSANIPASRPGGFPRGNISPTSRRIGFRSSSSRINSLDYASRSAIPRIRPTASSRLRGSRQSASIQYPSSDPNESETFATQQEESATEALDETTDFQVRLTTNNPLLKFRRPPIARLPGTAISQRPTTPSSRRSITTRGRTTTTRRSTTRSTTNPLLSLRRQRPNTLFPRRNLFKQPEPEPEEEIRENEQKVEDDEELLEEEEFEEDNDYESSDRKEEQVASPVPSTLRKNTNTVKIRPFAFNRRVKRQVNYGNRKFSNFRRPGAPSTRRPDPEPDTEPPQSSTQKQKPGRYNSRLSVNSKTTPASAPKQSSRQPFIIRGESRTTTTNSPAYRRGKARPPGRTTTLSSRLKAPRLSGKSTQSSRPGSSRPSSGRSRPRTTTSKASSRQRNSFENLSGERRNKYDNILNDGNIREPISSGQPFNTNAIIYDNSPWRPGRGIDVDRSEDERKLKNLATRIMSNGVEVLVKDKSAEGKQEQRKLKLMHLPTSKPTIYVSSTTPKKKLLSSAVATFVNRQQMSAFFPLHQLMQHNYIIKTCMTTYTYLTTVVQNKRSAVSTFETIVSVVTTESLTNLYATDVLADIKPTKTKYMEVKTIQPSASSNIFLNIPKIDKRIDNEDNNFDLIQPSEMSHSSCTTSCTCSHTQTETLKTKHTNFKPQLGQTFENNGMKSTKYSGTKLEARPTHKGSYEHTQYRPYEYETSSQGPPNDKVVEKYTQVKDYSDENDDNTLDMSDLLTNEQAPVPPKTKSTTPKPPEKSKPQKVNKNKLVVAELIKLGSLGIKGLSQLAPVIEKMTGGFMRRQETNKTTTTTTTVKPSRVTGYNANKRIDNDLESKHNNFPIYIPVDEMETSESQIGYTNVTLQQNFAWAADHKHSKAHLIKSKIVHESPLVNGGIPISPGEIITANSDVIVGKPAVGGPLSLVGTGIKLQSQNHSPTMDSIVANSEHYHFKEKPLNDQILTDTKIDDSYDLRPPELPKFNTKPNKNLLRPQGIHYSPHNIHIPSRGSGNPHLQHENTEQISYVKDNSPNLVTHGRPYLDYGTSSATHLFNNPTNYHVEKRPLIIEKNEQEVLDNSPSSSEIVSTKITTQGEEAHFDVLDSINKPFLVDIQPSRVANVIIPHGSSTALVFAGSSEPHKTGDYVDDPLPYPEPGYFGSFSIDAPHMTNVHNVVVNKNPFLVNPNGQSQDTYRQKGHSNYKEIKTNNDQKNNWNDNKRPKDLIQNTPSPTSNQVSHIQVGPHITVYNPENYKGDFEKYNQAKLKNKPKEGNKIDKEYENYLAVPPPPPKRHYNQENHYDSSKPFLQRPNVRTKPIHESNVFINIQHPVPNQLPPKITSEIYFASQLPNSQPTPTYNLKIPYTPTVVGNPSKLHKNIQPHKQGTDHFINPYTITSSNSANKSITSSNKENTYTVTLNTATNVASSDKSGHVMSSSITVPITTISDNGQINANIPIGTNFAIRVEDDPAKYESVALHGKIHPSLVFEEKEHVLSGHSNNYKEKNSTPKPSISQLVGQKFNNKDNKKVTIKEPTRKNIAHLIPPSLNSHANFPMTNEDTNSDVKINQYVNYEKNINTYDHNRLSHLVPNISTNSHGWYSSVLKEDNLKDIKIETSTRKVIPLKYDKNNDNLPYFGEKIATVGKPPTEFWGNKNTSNNFNIGKPFSKTKEHSYPNNYQFPIKPNFIPAIYGTRQTAYDIPIVENKDVPITIAASKKPPRLTYETAEEIYDGVEETFTNSEIDGEVSSESMKVPIISASQKRENVSFDSSQNTQTSLASQSHNASKHFIDFNPGTQTEKPFKAHNKSTFHSNNINPIYSNNLYSKPRPFTVNTAIPLDHLLQQPHWQINQLMENATNISYEDIDLNTGEDIHILSSSETSTTKDFLDDKETDHKYGKIPNTNTSVFFNNSRHINESNIITSIVHIHNKKPFIVEKHKSTPPTFTINYSVNNTSSEIIDLSPPPPAVDYKFKPAINNNIMGMTPPTPPSRLPSRTPLTPRPVLPIRTPPYRNVPPRTLPPRQSTLRPVRKPINRDEVSTYRPAFDSINKVKRPSFNYDQPSSHLLPPPREPSKVVIENIPMLTPTASSTTSVIFPTPVSSGWLTSSNIGFSSSFEFAPTSVYFMNSISPSNVLTKPHINSVEPPSEEIFDSNEYDSSSETINVSYDIPTTEKKNIVFPNSNRNKEETIEHSKPISTIKKYGFHNTDPVYYNTESSEENTSKDKNKVIPLGNHNRTRKPYPFHGDSKKSSTSKLKLPAKTTTVIRPTKTLSRPIVAPTRYTSIRKNVRPLPSKPLGIFPTNIIESSESILEDDFLIEPTQVLQENKALTQAPEIKSLIEKTITSTLTLREEILNTNVISTHHSGNEIKISDEIIPTKTEFKTTIITLTKTLSEPPQIISSIGYVNLTHTLTVTHTKTSLVSQSEGAVTQTLVLTNTHTSTVVDVITEIYTQVQPTTIVETVTKHIPLQMQVDATSVIDSTSNTKIVALDDISMSSEERDNFIIKDDIVTENIQKIETDDEKENDTFFVVMNKSQNGGKSPTVTTDIDTGDYDGVTRNEQVNSNGVSQVLFGEILLAGTPYLETTNVGHPTGFGKECQPDCKASRNERCQRIDGIMKCVCRPGFARMFPDRPCKPTYTYSVRLGLGSRGNELLKFHTGLSDNSSKEYNSLAMATHEGINRMIMQSDLRDVYHGVHITGFYPIEMRNKDVVYQGVVNDFYVQLSDNAHESRLKEVIEKYLRNNNYSLGGTEVHAAEEFIDRLNVSDFDECTSIQFHDCSEHARCFNLRGTYTCSCLEGFADLSVNTMYPGRICSSDAVGCSGCNYHGTCFDRESAMICECFKWYAGRTCQVNLKAVLITVTVIGALVIVIVTIWASKRCCSQRSPTNPTFVIGCMQGMPSLHQGNMPSKQRADRRALIAERTEAAETCSVQNASLPYIPAKSRSRSHSKQAPEPPAHSPPPPPALMIPRARLHPLHDSRDNLSRRKSTEVSNEAKLISYLESGAININDEMRRKHSMESSYSVNKERGNKQGALVSAGFKVSTTIRPDENSIKCDRDDASSINKNDLDAELSRFDTLRKSYSQEDISEWTDAERRIGELTLSEARSVGGTLPASTGRAASSTRLTHQEANTMAERDLGSTFLLPHVHLYKPDLTSDVSEFDSL